MPRSFLAPGSPASDRAALVLTLAWAAATAAILAAPVSSLGMRILAAVVLWHALVVAVGVWRRDAPWRSAYTLVAPMSVALVLPDHFLAVALGTIVFPDTGAPFWGAVPVFMAGMWAIPLGAVVLVGRAADRRGASGVLAAALVGLAVFAVAEATAGVLPLWRPVGVPLWGPLAAYVLPAEAILCATLVVADRWARERPAWARLVAGALVVQAYTGGLALGWLALGR